MENNSKANQHGPAPKDLPLVGITLGDANGIGPEVIIKALQDPHIAKTCRVVVYGNQQVMNTYRNLLQADDLQFQVVSSIDQAQGKKPSLINIEADFEVTPGKSSPAAGKLAAEALFAAVKDMKDGHLQAVVTAPITKANMPREVFNYPGHTEFFGEQVGVHGSSLMLLVHEDLRVAVASGHVPINQVPQMLTERRLEGTIKVFLKSLVNDFGVMKPRLAVLGLNPHAGENGKIGQEEKQVIDPVINRLRDNGHQVYGPFAADGFFGSGEHRKYDGVLAMYHDQGLIPFKTLAFDTGVNFTAGLTVVRTSPDHGTAYDLAGKNEASADSMKQAILVAIDVLQTRQQQKLAPPQL